MQNINSNNKLLMNIFLKSNFYFKNFKIYFDMILSYYFFYPSITYKI